MSQSDLMMEFNAKAAIWRQKAADGTLSQEEMREAIQLLRTLRGALPEVGQPKAKGKGRSAPKPSGDDLLSELGV